MRPLYLFVTICCLLAGWSCRPGIVFGEPQPAELPALGEIPRAYHGTFWCAAEAASLKIDRSAMVRRKELPIRLHKDEVAQDQRLAYANGRLQVLDWEADFPAQMLGDTLVATVVLRDTVFALGGHQVLKGAQGHLVLNAPLDHGAWAVTVASLTTWGRLSFSRASLPEDLERLKDIVPLDSVSHLGQRETQVLIRPTRAQFFRLLQEGVLFTGDCTQYERVAPLDPAHL
ncbi:hypothetical protein [Maribacter sp. 2307ULW6-5]|uniref:hypothetical protein n=1 Tax=Maribacter sp. 2307ULW6-5 TaxID=3386275 RepID=UPI0039BC885F